MTLRFRVQYRPVLIYGASLAGLLILMKWLEWHFIIVDYAFEFYAGALAVIFTLLGIWLAVKLTRPKTIIVEKEVITNKVNFVLNEKELNRLGLSKREMEVLQLMSEGLSNSQIASRLFVSLNTIKTHVSKIFEKLEVQRRTHAVDTARRLDLIP